MGSIDASVLEKPLSKSRGDLLGYAAARVLEALLEGILALGFLERGYTRSAAGRGALQAWRALTATLPSPREGEAGEADRGGGEKVAHGGSDTPGTQ